MIAIGGTEEEIIHGITDAMTTTTITGGIEEGAAPGTEMIVPDYGVVGGEMIDGTIVEKMMMITVALGGTGELTLETEVVYPMTGLQETFGIVEMTMMMTTGDDYGQVTLGTEEMIETTITDGIYLDNNNSKVCFLPTDLILIKDYQCQVLTSNLVSLF